MEKEIGDRAWVLEVGEWGRQDGKGITHHDESGPCNSCILWARGKQAESNAPIGTRAQWGSQGSTKRTEGGRKTGEPWGSATEQKSGG